MANIPPTAGLPSVATSNDAAKEAAKEQQRAADTAKKHEEATKELWKKVQTLEKIKEISKETEENLEKQFKLDEQLLQLAIAKYEEAKKINSLNDDQLKKLKKLLDDEEKRLDSIRQEKELKAEITKESEKHWKILDSITGTLSTQVKNLFSVEGVYKAIGIQLTDILDGNAKFAQVTGQIAERTFLSFGTSMSQFGLGFKELNDASMELFTSMTNFSNLNTTTQLGLAESAAKMNIFGVAVSTTGKNFDDLTKGLKMNSAEAIATNDNIAKAAIGAGIAPSKMLSEFGANMPRMAAYGKQGISVFIDLEKQAKSLGIEVGNLNAIVGESFDTFAGSAKAAGQFNAVLGGNFLNSMEMLNATESERIVLLKQSFDESGKSFDALGKYEKKAIAATLGISDLNEASKLFGKSTTELTMDMAKNAASQERMEEIQREGVKIMDSLRNVFNSFLPAIRFVAWAIKGLADGFARLNDGTKGFFGIGIGLFLIIPKLSAVFGWLKTAIGGVATEMGGFFKSFASGSGSLATGISTIGKAAASSAGGLIALAFAVTLIGLGIGIAAGGLSLLVASFKDLGANSIGAVIAIGALVLAFYLMIPALIAAGTAAVFATGPLYAVAGAVLIIGGAIAIAAYGMSVFVNSLAKLGEVGQGFFMAALGVGVMATSISKLAVALTELPDNKMVMVTTVTQAINEASKIRPEEIEPATGFVTAMKTYYIAQAASKDANQDALVVALKEVMQSSKKEEASKNAEKKEKIYLVLEDGKEFPAYVRKVATNGSIFSLQSG